MVRKPDERKKLMEKLRVHQKNDKLRPPSFAETLAAHNIEHDDTTDFAALFLPQKYNQKEQELWDELAREALKLGSDDQADREMRQAFRAFKLDHRHPMHWRLLLTYFCHVEFAEKRKRKPKWSGQDLIDLQSEIKKRKMEKTAASRVAPALIRDKNSKFYGRGREIVRQMIGVARKLDC